MKEQWCLLVQEQVVEVGIAQCSRLERKLLKDRITAGFLSSLLGSFGFLQCIFIVKRVLATSSLASMLVVVVVVVAIQSTILVWGLCFDLRSHDVVVASCKGVVSKFYRLSWRNPQTSVSKFFSLGMEQTLQSLYLTFVLQASELELDSSGSRPFRV